MIKIETSLASTSAVSNTVMTNVASKSVTIEHKQMTSSVSVVIAANIDQVPGQTFEVGFYSKHDGSIDSCLNWQTIS